MPIRHWLVISLLLISVTSGEAVIRYVDKDVCPTTGSGTTGDPYCSIQSAFDAVNPGDIVRIRNSATPYDGEFTLNRSGSPGAGNEIIVESDPGHTPILRNSNGSGCADCTAIYIRGMSYITVQNLTFDGTGVNHTRHAIHMDYNGAPGVVNGNKVLNNTFQNISHSDGFTVSHQRGALFVNGGYCGGTLPCPMRIQNITVQGNTFTNIQQAAMLIHHLHNSLFENNTIVGISCGYDNGATNSVGIRLADGYFRVHAGSGSGLIFRGNTIRDWPAQTTCGMTPAGYGTAAGIWCDVGTMDSTFEGNLVYNIHQADVGPPSRASQGIFIEAGCQNWTMKNNIVYNIGVTAGRQRLEDDTYVAAWLNNTFYNVGNNNMQIADGVATIENNIFYNAGDYNLHFNTASSGKHTINYNLYWDNAGGNKVGVWGGGLLNFANWKTACGCDANGINANPQFVASPALPDPTYFKLQLTSPAATSGLALTTSVPSDYGSVLRTVPYSIGAWEFVTGVPTPVACWEFNGNGVDSTGLGHTATFPNGSTFPTSPIGQALGLNGTNQYGTVADAADLNMTGNMSIDFWANFASIATDVGILDKEQQSGNFPTPYMLTAKPVTGTPRYEVYFHGTDTDFSSVFTFTGYAIPIGSWHHVAITRDTTLEQVSLWVNGAFVQTLPVTGWTSNPAGSTGTPLIIGGRQGLGAGSFMQGQLDELCLYPYVLTSGEIAARAMRGVQSVPILTRKVR